MKRLITHHGKFHADDVFATAWLKRIYGDTEVIRIDREDVCKYRSNDECFVYDIGNGKYDHHSKKCRERRPNGNLYASFGKIVRDTYHLVGFDRDTYLLFDKLFVTPIDVVDNNGPSAAVSQHSDVVRALNEEDLYSPEQDAAFKKAVEYADTVLDIMINKYIKDKKLETEAADIAHRNKGRDIVVLERFYPTEPFKKEGIKFVVYKDFNHWNCHSTSLGDFRVTCNTNDSLIFRHDSGSFASFKTKAEAIKAAEMSLGGLSLNELKDTMINSNAN